MVDNALQDPPRHQSLRAYVKWHEFRETRQEIQAEPPSSHKEAIAQVEAAIAQASKAIAESKRLLRKIRELGL